VCKSVYIILLNYKGYRDTIECLESLTDLHYANYTVVVCDNASPDGSEQYIRAWAEENRKRLPIKFLQTGANLGFAGGNNVGIRYALDHRAEYIWLLNNDTIVEADALAFMIDKMEANDRLGICGSRLMSYHHRDEIVGLAGWNCPVTSAGGHILKTEDMSRFTYVIGASMLFRREVFENVGLLQDDYFLYYEELDIAERIRGKYEMDVALDSVVYHKEGASIGNQTAFSEFYSLKNCLKYTWRFHRRYFPIVFMRFSLHVFWPVHARPYKRVHMFFKVIKNFLIEIHNKDFQHVPVYVREE